MDSLTPEIPALCPRKYLLEQNTAERWADQTSEFPFVFFEANCYGELPDAVPGPVPDPGVLGILRKLRWGLHSICEGREF